jgi:uncharacterized membrane protein YeaQ/YmgE (transglycosylase-associated protein family)
MARSKRDPAKPVDLRAALPEWEPGAHLYATFGGHAVAGLASLAPFAVLFFTAQSVDSAMKTLVVGGFVITPIVLGIYTSAWAGMSYALLHRLRYNDNPWTHYLTYALTGAVVLLISGMTALFLIRIWQYGGVDFWNSPAFTNFLWGTPLFGAVGAAFGRWVLSSRIRWCRWIARPALPQVFDFVEGKRDKDDFERM